MAQGARWFHIGAADASIEFRVGDRLFAFAGPKLSSFSKIHGYTCSVDRSSVADELNSRGYADLGPLLSDQDIAALTNMYSLEDPFRSHIIMRRHGFGEGEYKYFANPLPKSVASLRQQLYSILAPIANHWQECVGAEQRFPKTHKEMLARCHADGQTRPTPLMLKYGQGDFNCLHQDLYGEYVFPLQVVILLSDVHDFAGGEFVLTEQRPRMQSRVEVVQLRKGHGVAFTVSERPKLGSRGHYRVKMRHGVSQLRSGERYTLGIIFHDAA